MIRELLNLKKNKRKLFKRHFIRNVFVEVRFSDLSREIILKNQDLFKEKFKELNFNEQKTIKQIEFKMSIEENEPKKITRQEDAGLIFLNTNDKKQLEILENKLVCVDNQYDNFDSFLPKINDILKIINDLNINNNKIVHVGFRKINTIISTETKSYKEIIDNFNSAMFAQLRTNLIPFENFNCYRDNIEIQKNNHKCIINSSCMKKNDNNFEINLDISIIDNNLMEKFNIIEKLNQLNQLNYDLFLWSITDNFKKIMNEKE